MNNEYDITIGEQIVGQAIIEKLGLYYNISCTCSLTGQVIYRVIVRCGDREENLGVCVPGKESFVLHTKIPIKRLGEGEFSFRAVPRHGELQGKFIPLCPEEPFGYIDRLYAAYLSVRENKVGIIIENDTL